MLQRVVFAKPKALTVLPQKIEILSVGVSCIVLVEMKRFHNRILYELSHGINDEIN